MDIWTTPHVALAFFALTMAIISFWVKKSPWLWGAFLLLACILGFFAKLITPQALIPIGALLILHAFLSTNVRGLPRFFFFALASAISIGLLLKQFPGFTNIKVIQSMQLSKGAYPFNLWLSFSKPFVGMFILAFSLPLLKSLREFERLLKIALPLSLAGVAILITLSLTSGLIRWDPKFPPFFWFFAIENLLLVCIVDEAFWRGFIQTEVFRFFGQKGFFANVGAVLVSSFFYAALYYYWVPNIPFLGLVMIAGMIFGSIYQITKAIEGSILCHYLVNLTHFLLFSYPALRP